MIKKKSIYKIGLPFVILALFALILSFSSMERTKVVSKNTEKPEENRFTKIVLAEKLDEPMELTVLPDGRVLFVERKGNVKVYDPAKKAVKVIAKIPVSTKYTDKEGKQKEAEDGLLGVAIDPNFTENNWIYLFYSPEGGDPKNILTRYELRGEELVEASQKILLEVPTQREECCHTGGSIAFDEKGNLFVSTGDNTNPHGSQGFSPIDERPGRSPWDAQKSSGNTNDLRGKILRIHPELDGTYTIPEGNLFPKGDPKARPEIYTMGHRNPFRISVDKKTGFVYWGDVGPDSSKDSVKRGPRGHDEVNQAKKAGNFGWPYFVGDNKAYNDFDFERRITGEKFDVNNTINNSPNNTGLNKLPPSEKAFVWYAYDASEEFPLVGSGGRTAMAGPVFYSEDFKNAKRAFPEYYNGKLFIYEWMRGWIMAVTMDQQGNYVSMERFMPSHKFSNPMDMEFSSDGDLYMLEYGTTWFQGNDDAKLIKIEYNGGNRKPVVKMNANKKKGAVPLAVQFSSKGSEDLDKDEIKFEWKILSKSTVLKTFNSADASFTFSKPGVYHALLTITDGKGEKSEEQLEIIAGNEPPVITLDITKGNKTFFFPGKSIVYDVKVTDKEEGSTAKGTIAKTAIAVTADYLEEGFDVVEIAQGHRSADEAVSISKGQKLIDASDCRACHNTDKKSIGPSYKMVAEKYKGKPEEADRLAQKIINGGSGVWGEVAMSAHPTISVEDATEMVGYILNLANEKKDNKLPASGSFTTTVPDGDKAEGVYILRAAYTDKGANGIPGIRSEKTITLRSPKFTAASAEEFDGIKKNKPNMLPYEILIAQKHGAFIGFKKIDLTDVSQINVAVSASKESVGADGGGKIEVHLDSPDGPIIGTSNVIVPDDAAPKSINKQTVKAKVIPTEGFHNVYFVCKNDKATEGKPLFTLVNVELIP